MVLNMLPYKNAFYKFFKKTLALDMKAKKLSSCQYKQMLSAFLIDTEKYIIII